MTSITTTVDASHVAGRAVGLTAALVALMAGVAAATPLGALDVAAVSATMFVAAWWILARDRMAAWLNAMSFAPVGILAASRLASGPRAQMVPWQVVAVTVAASAVLRAWRPGRSRRWTRVIGRTVLVAGVVLGTAAGSLDPVPQMPRPTGPHSVGSQVFHWSDGQRAERFTVDTGDVRRVVAQAWYPAEASEGPRTPYIESTAPVAVSSGLPDGLFAGLLNVDTHATDLAHVAGDRETWPVVVFSPGLGVARQAYTALATELASRGYVVVTVSHTYDSPATSWTDGSPVAAPKGDKVRADLSIEEQVAIRAADVVFVLDQLTALRDVHPSSPLVGHLDLDHVGVMGHSLGGAMATQVLASDARFLAGINIDGRLFGPVPRVDQPFLWIQVGAPREGRDEFLEGMRGGGALVTVEGSTHMGFSDTPAYLTPTGRAALGTVLDTGTIPLDAMTRITADLTTSFFGPILGGASGDLESVSDRESLVTINRRFAPA